MTDARTAARLRPAPFPIALRIAFWIWEAGTPVANVTTRETNATSWNVEVAMKTRRKSGMRELNA